MTDNSDVTLWTRAVRDGDEQAAQRLWEHYFARLMRLARKGLSDMPTATYDEEDAVLSAFNSFVNGVQADRFPQLDDRHNIWRLLVVITKRKIAERDRYQHRQRRGGDNPPVPATLEELEQLLSDEPAPDFAAEFVDQYERLINSLKEEPQRTIALMKLEGFTNEEIATKLNCAKRTVQRKLELIRASLEEVMAAESTSS
jgi:RNA polymerase sigma factor (sigma-70 family)